LAYLLTHCLTKNRRGGRRQDSKQSFAEEEDGQPGEKQDGEENKIIRKHGPPAKSGFLGVG